MNLSDKITIVLLGGLMIAFGVAMLVKIWEDLFR